MTLSGWIAEKLPDWAAQTDWGQALLQKQAKDLHLSRTEWSQELSAARAQVAKEAPGLSARVEKTREYLEEARTAVKEAEVAAQQAMAALSSLSNQTERTISRCERELRASADSSIAAFVGELADLRQQARSSAFARELEVDVRTRQAKLMELSASAEALQLEVDADVAGRLTELRTAAALLMLPSVTKPVKKGPEPESSHNYWARRQQRRPESSPGHETEQR